MTEFDQVLDALVLRSRASVGARAALLPAVSTVPRFEAPLRLATGVHGAGKADDLELRAAELLAAGVSPEDVVYLDASDARLQVAGCGVRAFERLAAWHAASRPASRLFLFCNRIDLIAGWETALARLFGTCDLHVCATGERSSWLAGAPCLQPFCEVPQVTERFPLNLVAFAARHASGQAAPSAALDAYLELGGLSAALDLREPHRRPAHLQALVRDAVSLAAAGDRRLGQVPGALATAGLALASAGQRFSVTAAVRTLGERGVRTTRAMVAQQLDALADLHLVYAVLEYEAALKENPRAAATLYAGDHALPAAFAPAGAPGRLVVAKNAVYLHLRRADLFGGIYAYRVAPGPGGTVDFAVGNPATGSVHALFHVVEQAQGQALKRAAGLLDRALERTGLRTAALIHLGERHTACATPHGTVRCIPLRDWLLGE